MKLTKSTLSRIINEELTRVLYELDAVDEGEDEHGNYVWDSTVKRSEDAMKRKKRLADRMPDHIRGKTRNPETGEDEPYEEGADRGDRGPHIGGQVSKTHAGAFDYDKGEDEVYEEHDDNWIQDVNKDIKKRGTKGRCTGDKFGSESCPEGSREYDLAKTFKKMGRERREKDHHPGKRDY